jgi:hypothetical protein
MRLFDLFRKSEWRKLGNYPVGVQQDIVYLVAFDALIKTAITSAIRRSFTSTQSGITETVQLLSNVLSGRSLTSELLLGILSTGIGKEFTSIKWSYLPPARAVGFLGILAMCEFRNDEQLIVQNDLKHSGFSSDPDEARSQYLILAAQTAGVEDLDEIKDFNEDQFLEFWNDLRKVVFQDIQLNVSSETPGLSSTSKERFESLSQPRQQTLLLLADSLSKKKPNTESPQAAPPKAAPPFNLQLSQKEHPFKYVPYPKLVKSINQLSPEILNAFEKFSIDDYELRRLVGAKDFVPRALLHGMAVFDADALAYCIVVAAVIESEPTFVGCGVWKKVTEIFEKRNLAQFQLAAEAQVNGMLGDAKLNMEINDPKKASLGLNLLQEIRRAPTNYSKAGGDDLAKVSVLMAGTTIFRHVLNHPRYGKTFSSFVMDKFTSLAPVLEEIKTGELLTWDQQKDLTV